MSKNIYFKSLSFVLAFSFLLTELSYTAPVESIALRSIRPLEALAQNPTRFQAPLDFSSLKEIHHGSRDKLIIHIQDAHSNLSGQRNLAATLDKIMTQYGVSLVLVEGGAHEGTLTPLRNIIPKDICQRTAKSLFIEGQIAGEEYLNLTSNHPMKIMGIEDISLYAKSITSYGSLADKREDILHYLKVVQRALDKLKTRLYPKEILAYEKQIKGGDKGQELDFKGLLELAKSKTLDLKEFPNLQKIEALFEKEKKVDFQIANLEQAALIEKIKDGGWRIEDLGKIKNSRTAQFTFLQNIFTSAKEKNISLQNYPNLILYGEYLKDFADLDLDGVIDESLRLEDKVYVLWLPDQDSRLVRAIDRYTKLLLTAYKIQMTTKEFNFFQANEPDFATAAYLAFINRKLADLGYFQDLISYRDILEEGKEALINFYDSVDKRDIAFIQNTERILQEENQKVAVLITGGYHTPHLKKLAIEKGYSWAVLTPIVTSETNQKKYEKLLLEPMQKETKLIEVIQGQSRKKAASTLEEELILAKKHEGARMAAVVLRPIPFAELAGISTNPDVASRLAQVVKKNAEEFHRALEGGEGKGARLARKTIPAGDKTPEFRDAAKAWLLYLGKSWVHVLLDPYGNLEVSPGKGAFKIVRLDQAVIIGRSPGGDNTVSRRHASVTLVFHNERLEFQIINLSDTNGLYIKESSPLQSVVLENQRSEILAKLRLIPKETDGRVTFADVQKALQEILRNLGKDPGVDAIYELDVNTYELVTKALGEHQANRALIQSLLDDPGLVIDAGVAANKKLALQLADIKTRFAKYTLDEPSNDAKALDEKELNLRRVTMWQFRDEVESIIRRTVDGDATNTSAQKVLVSINALIGMVGTETSKLGGLGVSLDQMLLIRAIAQTAISEDIGAAVQILTEGFAPLTPAVVRAYFSAIQIPSFKLTKLQDLLIHYGRATKSGLNILYADTDFGEVYRQLEAIVPLLLDKAKWVRTGDRINTDRGIREIVDASGGWVFFNLNGQRYRQKRRDFQEAVKRDIEQSLTSGKRRYKFLDDNKDVGARLASPRKDDSPNVDISDDGEYVTVTFAGPYGETESKLFKLEPGTFHKEKIQFWQELYGGTGTMEPITFLLYRTTERKLIYSEYNRYQLTLGQWHTPGVKEAIDLNTESALKDEVLLAVDRWRKDEVAKRLIDLKQLFNGATKVAIDKLPDLDLKELEAIQSKIKRFRQDNRHRFIEGTEGFVQTVVFYENRVQATIDGWWKFKSGLDRVSTEDLQEISNIFLGDDLRPALDLADMMRGGRIDDNPIELARLLATVIEKALSAKNIKKTIEENPSVKNRQQDWARDRSRGVESPVTQLLTTALIVTRLSEQSLADIQATANRVKEGDEVTDSDGRRLRVVKVAGGEVSFHPIKGIGRSRAIWQAALKLFVRESPIPTQKEARGSFEERTSTPAGARMAGESVEQMIQQLHEYVDNSVVYATLAQVRRALENRFFHLTHHLPRFQAPRDDSKIYDDVGLILGKRWSDRGFIEQLLDDEDLRIEAGVTVQVNHLGQVAYIESRSNRYLDPMILMNNTGFLEMSELDRRSSAIEALREETAHLFYRAKETDLQPRVLNLYQRLGEALNATNDQKIEITGMFLDLDQNLLIASIAALVKSSPGEAGEILRGKQRIEITPSLVRDYFEVTRAESFESITLPELLRLYNEQSESVNGEPGIRVMDYRQVFYSIDPILERRLLSIAKRVQKDDRILWNGNDVIEIGEVEGGSVNYTALGASVTVPRASLEDLIFEDMLAYYEDPGKALPVYEFIKPVAARLAGSSIAIALPATPDIYSTSTPTPDPSIIVTFNIGAIPREVVQNGQLNQLPLSERQKLAVLAAYLSTTGGVLNIPMQVVKADGIVGITQVLRVQENKVQGGVSLMVSAADDEPGRPEEAEVIFTAEEFAAAKAALTALTRREVPVEALQAELSSAASLMAVFGESMRLIRLSESARAANPGVSQKDIVDVIPYSPEMSEVERKAIRGFFEALNKGVFYNRHTLHFQESANAVISGKGALAFVAFPDQSLLSEARGYTLLPIPRAQTKNGDLEIADYIRAFLLADFLAGLSEEERQSLIGNDKFEQLLSNAFEDRGVWMRQASDHKSQAISALSEAVNTAKFLKLYQNELLLRRLGRLTISQAIELAAMIARAVDSAA